MELIVAKEIDLEFSSASFDNQCQRETEIQLVIEATDNGAHQLKSNVTVDIRIEVSLFL